MLPPNYFYWFRIDNKHMTESWLDQAPIDLAYRSESVILSDPSSKDGRARFTKVPLKPWNLNLIKNGEVRIVFQLEKSLILIIYSFLPIGKKWASHFCRGTTKENKQFKETKTWISKSYLIRQSFKGYRWKSGIAIFAWMIPIHMNHIKNVHEH